MRPRLGWASWASARPLVSDWRSAGWCSAIRAPSVFSTRASSATVRYIEAVSFAFAAWLWNRVTRVWSPVSFC
ncbi:hypothetical protein HFP69_35575 [Streptomyces sp. ARC12]|uniref:hypothetical protein n=1 Tax=Streptomyces sp. ARC12 TaxID=2724151 RepID=UPI003857A5CB